MGTKRFVASRTRRITSLVTAVLLVASVLFTSASGAYAREPLPSSPPSNATSLAPAPGAGIETPSVDATTLTSVAAATSDVTTDALPAGAREIVAKRDRFTTHYALPDGKGLAVISAGPVHYLDDSRTWQDIDTQMVPENPTTYRNAANDFTIQAGDDATSAPVSVSKGDWKVSLDLQGTSDGEPIVAGSDASYIGTSTTLAYTSVPQGLKETIYLASADAPDTYTFSLDASGCVVRGNAQDGYILDQLGSPNPVGELHPLVVSDSSQSATICAGATMQVTPTPAGATVTYHIPRSWIADPARVFPIVVDPGLEVTPPNDTWAYAGSPNSNYNTDSREDIGNPGTSSTGWYRSFLNFDLTGLYGVNVDAATMDLYYAYGTPSTSINCLIERPPTNWSSTTLTWNNQPALSGSTLVTSQTIGGSTQKWDYFDVTPAVNYYLGNTTGSLPTNMGFRIRTTEGSAGYTHYYQFVSGNDSYSPHWPQLWVTYDQPTVSADAVPTGTIAADGSSTTTLTVRAAYPLPSGCPGSSMIRGVWIFANAGNPNEEVGDWYWSDASGSGAMSANSVLPGVSTNWSMSTDASGTRVLSIGFTHSASYPNAQNVTYQVYQLATAPTTSMYNAGQDTQWGPYSLGGNLQVLPGPLTISSGSSSVASCGTWYQPQDPDGDGVVNNPDNTNGQGRGWANLSWPSGGAIATGYHVYMSDGYTMRQVASITGSGTTSWTTHNAGLYPGDSTIASLPANTPSNSLLTTATGGLDLRDNPNALYAKTGGTSLDGSGAYDFKVVPYNAIGEANASQCGTWATTLPNSSLPTSGPQPPVFCAPCPANGAVASTLAPAISIGASSTAPILSVAATIGSTPASATFSPLGASVGTITVSIPGGQLTSPSNTVQVSANNTATSAATVWTFSVAGPSFSSPAPANGTTITTPTSVATCALCAPAGIATSTLVATVDSLAAPSTLSAGVVSVSLPALLAGSHTVSLFARDNFGQWNVASWSFNVPAPPAPVTASANTTSSTNWFTESDTNSDGINDVANNDNSSGRGSVALTWPAAIGATSYHVYLFDGATWRQVASTASTSWSSLGAGIYPTDSSINALPASDTTDPFPSGSGLDLRDDPAALYAKTGGDAMSSTPDYFFKVVPCNASESALSACPTLTVELANRSVRCDAAPNPTTWDAGEMAGHSATVYLDGGPGDTQRLELATTDLKIASYGPAAEVSRVYRSDLITPRSSGFAPGWFFNFDSSVVATSGGALYTDTAGQTHEFYAKPGGGYLTPVGMHSTLTTTSTGFQLALYGGEVLAFDSSHSGRISRESDRNGNCVTYAWSATSLAITAANGQQITVSLPDGQTVASATWQARQFDYAAGSSSATVTCYANTTDAYSVVYGYSNGELSSLCVPTFGAVGGESARWGFVYGGSAPTTITYPGYGSSLPDENDYQTQFAYGANSATVSRWGTVGGQADTLVTTNYAWNPDGSEQSVSNPNASGQLTSYTYDANSNQLSETDSLGRTTSCLFDGQGNEIASSDALGNLTTTTYDSFGEPLTVTDPRGAITSDTYDSNGNLTRQSKTLDASDTAATTYVNNSLGQQIESSQAVSATSSIVTQYAYDPCGQVASTKILGVALDASSSAVQDVTTDKYYDAEGDLVTATDALGNVTSSSYDTAGRQVTSTDPSGTVSNTAFDCLGNSVGTWKSNEATSSQFVSQTVLPTGQTYVETTWADTSQTTPAEIATTTYDALGNAVSTSDSVQGDSRTDYDASGQAVAQWAAGTDCSTPQQATRTFYDAAGQAVTETPAGNDTSSTVTTYDADGHEITVTDSDGSWSTNTYDADGNEISVTSPDDTSTATSCTGYDLGGRSVATTDNAGATSSSTYDLAGRLVASGGSSAADPSGVTSAYDNANWVVRSVDAAGVVTSDTLDADGRVTASDVGGQTTRTTYDACGRVVDQLNPDGSAVTYVYDVLGQPTRETHTSSSGAVVKDIVTTYDAAGRKTGSSDTAPASNGSLKEADSYASNPTSSTVTTMSGTPAPGTSFAQAGSTQGDGQEIGQVFDWSAADGSFAATRSITATDDAGRTTSEAIDNGVSTQNTAFAYDAEGNLVGESGDAFLASATVSYDTSTGLKTSDAWPLLLGTTSQDDTYTYTPDGRLASWQGVNIDGSRESLNTTYYPTGDIKSFSGLDTSGTTFSYSNQGANGHVATSTSAVATTTYSYDPQRGYRIGALTTGQGQGSWGYGYDAAGNLASVTVNSSQIATYTYDGNGQRLSATTASGTLVTNIAYDYDAQQLDALAATVTGSVSGTETYTITYAYTPDGRPYAGVFDDSLYSQPAYFSIVTDDRGDVIELLDQGGNPFASYGYGPWGESLAAPHLVWHGTRLGSGASSEDAAIASDQPLRYAGYVFDSNTGLYYCSARYYDPATMQFLTPDPEQADGEASAYQYCGGNPVERTDSTGLSGMKKQQWGSYLLGCIAPAVGNDSLEYYFSIEWNDVSGVSQAIGRVKYRAWYQDASDDTLENLVKDAWFQMSAYIEEKKGGSHYWVDGPRVHVGSDEWYGQEPDYGPWKRALTTKPYKHYWVQKVHLVAHLFGGGSLGYQSKYDPHTRWNYYGRHR